MRQMLHTMRSNVKALSWILWLVVGSFVLAIFWQWGRAGEARRGTNTGNWIAKVHGEPITLDELQDAYGNLERFYRQIYQGQFDPKALGLARQALNQLVRQRLLLAEARRVGLLATPEEIRARITGNPAFQQNGQFIGAPEYQRRLRESGLDAITFERGIAEGILIEKYERLATGGVSITPDEVVRDYRRRNETVTADYVLLDPQAFPAGAGPDDAALRAYFESHVEAYRTPERRRAAYVLLDPEHVSGIAPVTDEEAQAYYDSNRERLYTTPEQIRARHILIKVAPGTPAADEQAARARAESALTRVRSGEDFEALARAISEDTASAANGGDLGFFGRGRMPAPFEQAAFGLTEGATSDLVRSDLGFHLIQVTGRRAAGTRMFAEVKDAIVRQLQFSRSQKALAETVASFREAVAKDAGEFDRAAAQHQLTVRDTGFVAAGAAVGDLGDAPQAAAAMFQAGIGQVTPPVALPRGTVFLRTTEIEAPQPLTFDQARTQVENDLRRSQALQAARTRVAALSQSGADLAGIAKGLGVKVSSAGPFHRTQTPTPFSAAAREQAFALSPGQMSGPIETPGGLLLFRVTAREGFDPATFESQRESLAQSLLQQRRDRLFQSIVQRLEKEGEIELNQTRLAGLTGGSDLG
jgi:peptidyl-prolyl cis-trans isomerase D